MKPRRSIASAKSSGLGSLMLYLSDSHVVFTLHQISNNNYYNKLTSWLNCMGKLLHNEAVCRTDQDPFGVLLSQYDRVTLVFL